MKDISTLPNIDTATTNQDRGILRDDITPGDGHGTPVRQDWMNDLYYALRAILGHAGITPDGSVEGVTASQARQAIDRLLNGWPTRSLNKSADYTILDADYFDTLFVNTTSASVTITLPLLANNYGRRIRIVFAVGTTNTITIQTNTTDNGKLTTSGLNAITLADIGDSVVIEGSSLADRWLPLDFSHRLATCPVDITGTTLKITGDISGHADGDVALTGDQTIAGIKTFSSEISGSVTGHAHAIVETGTGAGVIRWKIIAIGAWNMDSTESVTIAHGITDADNIRSITVLIEDDDGNGRYVFSCGQSSGYSGYIFLSGPGIQLQRIAGGMFDNTLFDSTAFSRGYITIGYID